MQTSVESLPLTEDDIEAAKRQIREIAYFKWQAAGCPGDDALTFWREAEIQWIDLFYVANN